MYEYYSLLYPLPTHLLGVIAVGFVLLTGLLVGVIISSVFTSQSCSCFAEDSDVSPGGHGEDGTIISVDVVI